MPEAFRLKSIFWEHFQCSVFLLQKKMRCRKFFWLYSNTRYKCSKSTERGNSHDVIFLQMTIGHSFSTSINILQCCGHKSLTKRYKTEYANLWRHWRYKSPNILEFFTKCFFRGFGPEWAIISIDRVNHLCVLSCPWSGHLQSIVFVGRCFCTSLC